MYNKQKLFTTQQINQHTNKTTDTLLLFRFFRIALITISLTQYPIMQLTIDEIYKVRLCWRCTTTVIWFHTYLKGFKKSPKINKLLIATAYQDRITALDFGCKGYTHLNSVETSVFQCSTVSSIDSDLRSVLR